LCSALWSERDGASISGKWASVAFGTRPLEEVDLDDGYVCGREERNGGRKRMGSPGFVSVSVSKMGIS